jgi:DnaK suppressor protein
MMDLQAPDDTTQDRSPRLPELEPILTPADLARIERHLCEQRADLLAGIARLEAQMASSRAGDPSPSPRRTPRDGATPLAILRGELEKTTRALARLRMASYGFCQVCGLPIAPRRLAVIPSAERCDECARTTEGAPTTH